MRVNVTLACTECGDRNYITKKEQKEIIQTVLNLKKYCPRLKKSDFTQRN